MNNQLHPILEEEEDPKMFIEDDGWEEEEQVVPVDEDDAISDLNNEHTDEYSNLVTSLMR